MLDKPTETFEEIEAGLVQPFSYEKEKSKTDGVENVELKHTEKFLSPDDPFGHMFKDFGKSSAELRQVMEKNANAQFDEFHNQIKSEQHFVFGMIFVVGFIGLTFWFFIFRKLLKMYDEYIELKKTQLSNQCNLNRCQCHQQTNINKKNNPHDKGCYCKDCLNEIKKQINS